MGEVVSFTEDLAEGAARLYLRSVRGQDREPGKELPKYISELHLSNPWATPEIPALVYLSGGKVAGMLGVVPRAMEFQGQPIRLATMSVFMVDPEFRNSPAAIALLRRALKGPQDVSWTDGASGSVVDLWTAMGGYPGHLYAMNWIRILRPFGTARSGLSRFGSAGKFLKPLSGLLTRPSDYLLSQLPLTAVRQPVSSCVATVVGADELLGHINGIGWRESLKPSYSAQNFPWLMREASRSGVGNLRLLKVSSSAGDQIGWFIYYAVPDGASFVLQIGVRAKENFRDVMLALFRDAWTQGSVCVKGAAIPGYLTAMTELHCIFRHPHDRVAIHSKNPAIANALRNGEAAITRLDGIGWLRFSQESWLL